MTRATPPMLARWIENGRAGWRSAVGITVGVGLLAGFSAVGIDLDRALQVWRSSLHNRPATSRLALVEIDAKSLATLHRWPWSRDHYAAAIAELRRAGAQTIAFDVDFSAPSQPDQDAKLAAAIAHSPVPVILPTFRQSGSQDDARVLENLPIPLLRDHAQLAAVNIYADPDGLVRSYPYGIVTAGMPRPSIGAMLAGVAGRAGEGFPIDTSIDAATIPRVSFADLIAGHVPAGLLNGRSVLIGASAIELGDRYPIPGHGVIPGPMIQLIAAETLLQGSAPTDHGFLVPLFLAIMTVLAAGRIRRLPRGLTFAMGGGAILLLPMLTEILKLGSFEIVPALAALASAAIADAIGTAWRAAREARFFDEDTGLPNGRSFRKLLDENDEAAAVVLRLANYGDIASVSGKAATGEFVGRVAERLVFAGDTPVHRLDETGLAWLLFSLDAEEQVQRIDAAAAMLRAPFDVGGRRIELSHGFGVSADRGQDRFARAANAADRAVAQSLRWARYTDDMEKESEWRLGLASELDQAMSAGDIWVAYQPKLDIGAGRITASEALVRWRHPERGMIPPDAFIPALEDSGRIADLTLYVLERALADQAGWAAEGIELGVAVNMSALLPSDAVFVARLEAVLSRFPTAVPHLTLEVTESAAMVDPETAIRALDRLAQMGLSLSIDDYGTGQSTLSYLKRLPAREIKIDKGFVLGLENSKSDQVMVRSTIELAHELGFKVVAEGVETATALEMLASFRCDTAQGWHIGRPMPASDLLALIRSPLQMTA